MKPRLKKLTLGQLKAEARGVEDAPDLDPLTYKTDLDPIIFERVRDGRTASSERIAIVDGYHRAAGLIGWAVAADLKLDSIQIAAIDVTGYDEDVVAAAADGFGGESQEEALLEILTATQG